MKTPGNLSLCSYIGQRLCCSRYALALFSTWMGVCSAVAQDGFCMINGTTTGGAGGPTVTVTNGTDFNTQIDVNGPLIIQVQGPISIGRVTTKANKTIVGLGTNAALLGNLNVSDTTNVIIRNLHISSPGRDGLTIWNSQYVWVDHCTFYDTGDGACDMSRGSQYVTVSWCKFLYPTQLEHRFTMIADGYDNGGTITYGYYTLHHNWWSTRADQRMPASSFGRIHMYNNYFNCTNNSYCSNARNDTEINSETNYYAGVKDAVTVSSGTTGKIRTSGNTYSGCTGTIHPGTDSVFIPPYSYSADLAANVPAIVTAGAGAPGSDIVTFLPKIWDGGGANDNLNTANNWGYAGGYNEIPKEYDVMIFAGNTRLTPNNSYTANTEFTAINFSNNAGAFVLSGNAINLGQGISSESPATQTVNLNFSFAWAVDHYPTDRYFNVGSPSGSLVLNGAVSGPVNTYGRTYSVTKLGPGLLTLAGINGFAGSFNLNGGLLRFSTLDTALPGSLGVGSTLTFNGGGLQWAPGNTADISARNITINSGGATLDVGSNIVTVTNRIGNNGPGGLTKLGSGTLVFNATNNYKGNALVAEGVLALGLNGLLTNSPQIILSNGAALDVSGRADGTQTLVNGRSLTGSGTVRGSVVAAAGSTIAPGFSIGTLVITNALTFQANSTNLMELDATTQTNDLITGMSSVSFGGQLIVTNLSGALAAGNSFKLFNAGNYGGSFDVVTLPTLAGNLTWTNRLGIDGTIAVVAPVNTMPTNIIATPVGNELALDWPADHIGWIVQVQTNTSGDGLGTNWVNVPDSEATNHISFPMDPENGAVFFRLMLP